MNLRKITLLALTAVVLTLGSCGAFRRLGKDATVTVLSPWVITYGGFTDGMVATYGARDGFGGGAFTEVLVTPFTVVYHLVKHTIYVVAHVGDILLFPVYGIADLHPYAPDIEPLRYYHMGLWDGDDEADAGDGKDSGTDADSGEAADAGTE